MLVSPAAASINGISKSAMMMRRSGTSFKKAINQLADDSHKGKIVPRTATRRTMADQQQSQYHHYFLTTRTTTDRHGNGNDCSND